MGKLKLVADNNSYVICELASAYGVSEVMLDKDIYEKFKDAYIVPTGRHTEREGLYLTYRDGKKYKKLHRYILGLEDPNIFGDHINGNTLDNRRENLRPVTPSENIRNSKGMFNRKSKYKGVYPGSKYRWKVEGKLRGKWFYLGYFDDEESAATAYNNYIASQSEIYRTNKVLK